MFLKWLGTRSPPTERAAGTSSPVSFDEYLMSEIKRSKYINATHQNEVFSEIISGKKLKHGRRLSKNEKHALNINTKLTIYSAQLGALTQEALLAGPDRVLTAIKLSALHHHARQSSLLKMRDAGFPKFHLMDCKDERDCQWCKKFSGSIMPITTDINKIIRENCTCEYCRCGLRAVRK